jgi:hypothetical protein
VLFLEINEFSPELLDLAWRELDAKNIGKLLKLNHAKTTTDDKCERFGLDPWVQWVSIHTGKTSSQHGIQHLGDVPKLEHPQIWETLSKKGLTVGVWGAMNAGKGDAENCKFFFPDPWSFSEAAFPEELNNLLAFPRYYSKNYGEINWITAFIELLRLIKFCISPRIMKILFPLAPKLIKYGTKNGMPDYLLFVLFDLVNTALFLHYHEKSKPDFSILFLNSIAHLQHHKWTEKDRLSSEMKIAFTIFNGLLGMIFEAILPHEPMVIANAFSQYCSYEENKYLYRQINPEKFLIFSRIRFKKVEQAMTNDGHIFFDSVEDASNAYDILLKATVNGKQLFSVEFDKKNLLKIFYQCTVWEDLNDDSQLSINEITTQFFDLFERVTRRSGSHKQDGDIYYQGVSFPKIIYNHQIHGCLIDGLC